MYDGPISFVVITRNHAPYIVDCLRSIAAQPCEGELYVIDNASKDGTARNAAEYLSSYRGPLKTQLIALPHELPLCRFMNFALTLARYPIVKPFSGDDMLGPNFIPIFRQMSARAHADLWMAYHHVVDASATWPVDGTHPSDFSMQLGEDSDVLTPAEIIVGRYRRPYSGVTMIYRRDAWASVGGYDERFAFEDRSFLFNLATSGFTLRGFPVTTVYYRTHATQISKDPAFMARARVPVLYDFLKKARWENKPSAGYQLLRNVRVVVRDQLASWVKRRTER